MELKYIAMEQKKQTLLAVEIAENRYMKDGITLYKDQEENVIKLISSLYGYIKQKSYRYANRLKSDVDSIQKELEQEAILAVYKALEKYDIKKCPEFFPYVKQWIDAYIRAYQTKKKSMCKLQTRSARNLLSKIGTMWGKPIEEQIKILGISRNEYDSVIQALRPGKSILKPVERDSPEDKEEYLTSPTPTPEQAFFTKDLAEQISQIKSDFMKELDDKQKDVFENLVSGDESSFNITQKYGITRQRVQQIKDKVKEKFRKRLELNGISRNSINEVDRLLPEKRYINVGRG